MRDNTSMGSTGPVTSPAADQVSGGRPGLVGLAREAVCAPVSARALRELAFCLIEVPLGLLVVAIPVGLGGLGLLVALLTHGGPPPRRDHAHPGVVSAFGVAFILVLVALIVLAPRIARGLGAAHRRLAARLLGERIAGPPPLRRGGGPLRWLAVTLRDGPGWRAAAYLLVKLPVTVGEGYAVFLAGAGLANLSYPFWWAGFRNHAPGVRLGPAYA